ncbi:MAG: hypothetical protein K6B65_02820 [Bacilli bacterium]|nr:hypothetical protein [Bacilli bacterium]
MRDKLVRTGHKKAYYRLRAFGFAVLSLAGASVVAAAPVAISYGTSYSQIANAQENKDEEPVTEVVEESVEESQEA